MITDINGCIDLIKRQNELTDLTDKDIKELLNEMEAFIKKKYGEAVYAQVEKLCEVRNFDRAVKLLETLPKKGLSLIIYKKDKLSILMIFIVGIGILLSILISENVSEEQISIDWQKTEATVTGSRLGSNLSFNSDYRGYYPVIEYTYYVNGLRYHSDSIVFDSLADPEKLVDNYREGDIVDIHYNDVNHDQSFLYVQQSETGSKWLLYLFILAAIAGVFYFIKMIGTGKLKMYSKNS